MNTPERSSAVEYDIEKIRLGFSGMFLAIKEAGLTDQEMAEVFGSNDRQMRRWKQLEAAPSPNALRKVTQLFSLVRDLQEVLPIEGTRIWLFTPSKLLNDQSPAEKLADGKFEKVNSAASDLIKKIKPE